MSLLEHPVQGRVTESSSDAARGRCSGIPECCIAFFIEVWSDSLSHTQAGTELLSSLPRAVQYIPCPICLELENFVQIRACRPGCECRGV